MQLDHVGIIVKDLATARLLCESLLGMRVVDESQDAAFRMLTLRAENHEVHLFEPRSGEVQPRIDHLAYRVTSAGLDEAMSTLTARGVAYTGPHRYGATRFIKFRDASGVTWEYIAPAEDPAALARRYVAVHNTARASRDVEPLAALFGDDAVLRFDGGALEFRGRAGIARAFAERGPSDDLVEVSCAAYACGARMPYAWSASQPIVAGELDFTFDDDGRIRLLSITRRAR